jgi:hypothetical protein
MKVSKKHIKTDCLSTKNDHMETKIKRIKPLPITPKKTKRLNCVSHLSVAETTPEVLG